MIMNIKDEYNYIREAIAKTINTINEIKNSKDEIDVFQKIRTFKRLFKKFRCNCNWKN